MLNTKKILSVQKNFPSIELAKESLEMALAAASLEIEINLLFIEDGVFQLLKREQNDSLSGMLKALSIYGVQHVYVAEASLEERNLVANDLIIPIIPLSTCKIKEILNQHNLILS